jgi:hypothetical protein
LVVTRVSAGFKFFFIFCKALACSGGRLIYLKINN